VPLSIPLSCLHVVINHNINPHRHSNLRSHTRVPPVLVTCTNRLRGLRSIPSLQSMSRAHLSSAVYIHCAAAHTGLSGYKVSFSTRKFPILGHTAFREEAFPISLTSPTFLLTLRSVMSFC
jgi:hypothetical protein